MIALDQLTRAHFEPLVGQSFTCSDRKTSVSLTLAETRVGGAPRSGAAREPFALEFHGKPTLRIPQGIYRLEHATLGPMDIFLVQTGADATTSQFEAIFN